MARLARKKASTGIYHVMLRGADRRILFSDDEDNQRFLDTVIKVKPISGFRLYAYCLMGNHVHLLMEEGAEPIGQTFKRIGDAYVHYYNWKYELQGHLFQDRFRSECVETDAYFLDVLRYICQNPVKAGLCDAPRAYPWLGCSGITVDKTFLDSIGHLTAMGPEALEAYIMTPCEREHLEADAGKRKTDREAAAVICQVCGCDTVQEIGGYDEGRRSKAVREALKAGVSIRQLSRLTGISKAVIERIRR